MVNLFFTLLGMALTVYGAWLWYPPAAYIVAGVLFLAGAAAPGKGDGDK
jgi:hypothetical protein